MVIVTSRKGRVSRNVKGKDCELRKSAVTSRKGRVSRNGSGSSGSSKQYVTSRKGRVSRNIQLYGTDGIGGESRPARGV